MGSNNKLDFFECGGEGEVKVSAVMKQADRLYHVTSPVGTRPPNNRDGKSNKNSRDKFLTKKK